MHVFALLLGLSVAQALPVEQATIPRLNVVGEVMETMDAMVYTYVRLRSAKGEEYWVAGPRKSLKVGSQLKIKDAYEVRGFKSSTLKRGFDSLWMARTLGAPDANAALLPPHPVKSAKGRDPAVKEEEIAVAKAHVEIRASVSEGRVTAGTVTRATGEHGRTVSEVFGQAASLAGRRVDVQGIVTKAIPKILNRNWVHIEDGTGSAKGRDFDLVVTSTDLPTVGARVLVSGIVAVDRKFGAGYEYKVLVEEASISKK